MGGTEADRPQRPECQQKVDAVLMCDAVVKHESLSVEDVRFFQRVSLQHREGSSGTPFPPARAKMAWVAQRQTDLSDLNANKRSMQC